MRQAPCPLHDFMAPREALGRAYRHQVAPSIGTHPEIVELPRLVSAADQLGQDRIRTHLARFPAPRPFSYGPEGQTVWRGGGYRKSIRAALLSCRL